VRQRYRRFCYECEISISVAKAAVRFCDVYGVAKTTTYKDHRAVRCGETMLRDRWRPEVRRDIGKFEN
jgi:hypothetical protein